MRKNSLSELGDYMEPEGHELKESKLPGQAWNFQVTQIYDARKLRLYRDETHSTSIHLDGRGVKIAVMDTGIDGTNSDLEGRVKKGENCVDEESNDTKDYDGHGTWVAGLAGGKNEHRSIVPGAKLYPIKVEEERGKGKTRDMVKGMDWAINNRIDIIVIPRTTTSGFEELQEICLKARKNGIAVVASAGNYLCSARWPAGWPKEYAISIGAVEPTDESVERMKKRVEKRLKEKIEKWREEVKKWETHLTAEDIKDLTAKDTEHYFLSNKWPYTDFVAPGRDVVSAYRGNDYYKGSGTSIAAPHVAGILAMGLSVVRQVEADTGMQKLEGILGETAFKYEDMACYILARTLRTSMDPENKVFRDDEAMVKAMFGSGLPQAKDFIIRLCQYINSGSEKAKIFID